MKDFVVFFTDMNIQGIASVFKSLTYKAVFVIYIGFFDSCVSQ
ncbi:hypothetical protein HDC92_000613 [Pedobacter sp. AK017]|nr:hypothetical protein [Pedobacter sp. AK017]